MNNISINSIHNNISFIPSKFNSSIPNFCGKPPKKLIEKVMSVRDDKKVKLSFDDAVKIYEYLGYDVLLKRGSHAVIPIDGERNLTLVIPHKDKNICLFDIKKIKCVIKGDIDKALNI